MNDNHQPFVIRSPHNHILLFYIHGLMGSPLEFHRYANALAGQGFDFQAVLLPGHGSDGLAFARSNAAQWLNHVVCQLSLIRQDYDKVILIGHSMGALLALSTTERVPVDVYILVNGALKLRNPFCQMRRIFHMRNQPAEVLKPIIADYRSYFSINPSPIWSIPLWVKTHT
jgi:carboxylesterase